MTNGSTGNVLKMYGDINSDGNMLYIEYSCDTTRGNLYRNVMSFTAGTKPSIAGTAGDPMILLPIAADGSACFTYQTLPSGCVRIGMLRGRRSRDSHRADGHERSSDGFIPD